MSLPDVVSRDEWLSARTALLAKEKELTRARDALNAERRTMPMVKIEKDYVFTGPDGEASLLDLFEGRLQLILGHFMFDPEWEDGCPSCSAGADEMAPGLFEHLHARDTTLVQVSRAPIEKIRRTRRARAGPSPGTRPTGPTSTTTSTSRWTRPSSRPSTTSAPTRGSRAR